MIFGPLLLLLVLALLGALGYWLWRGSRTWPMPLRLLLIAMVITPVITPSLFAGGHGAVIVPVALVLLDSIYNQSGREFYEFVCKPLAVVGVIVYLLTSIVAFIRYLFLRAKSTPVA